MMRDVEDLRATPLSPSAVQQPDRRAWIALACLWFIYVLNFLDRQLLSILAKPIQDTLHISDSQLGLLGGLYFAAFYCFIAIPVGWLADRTNRVTVLAIACGIWSAATMACGMARTYEGFAAARMTVFEPITVAEGVHISISLENNSVVVTALNNDSQALFLKNAAKDHRIQKLFRIPLELGKKKIFYIGSSETIQSEDYIRVIGPTPFEDVRLEVDDKGHVWVDPLLSEISIGGATVAFNRWLLLEEGRRSQFKPLGLQLKMRLHGMEDFLSQITHRVEASTSGFGEDILGVLKSKFLVLRKDANHAITFFDTEGTNKAIEQLQQLFDAAKNFESEMDRFYAAETTQLEAIIQQPQQPIERETATSASRMAPGAAQTAFGRVQALNGLASRSQNRG